MVFIASQKFPRVVICPADSFSNVVMDSNAESMKRTQLINWCDMVNGLLFDLAKGCVF